MKKICTLFIVLGASVAACTVSENNTFPRPTAYPRPQLPDTVMIATNLAPLHFLANRDAVVSSTRDGWLDIAYPSLGATVHVTFTRSTPRDIASVKENRMERLMLNAGDRPITFSEFTNAAGFNVLSAKTEASTTPLQFLATDDSEWVVSGAVYFSSPGVVNAHDSIRPMIDAINYDILRSLKSLHRL